MADISANFAVRQFNVLPLVGSQAQGQSPLGGTAITAPIGCAQVVLENTDPNNSLQVYTDPQNVAMTSKTVPAGAELTLRASVLAWAPNAVICYITASTPNQVCTATFLR